MKEETKMKKWSLSRWKQEAWRWCSTYNRMKDCDSLGYGSCCTCSKRLHWAEGDAGHFQGGRGSGILFYDNGIHLQCKQCNGPRGGEQYRYGKYLEKRYGLEEVKKQQRMKHELNRYTRQDYQNFVENYKELIKEVCQ